MAPRTLCLALANLLIPVAVLVFAMGFFPYKPFMPGLATYEDLGWEEKMGWATEKGPEAQFDKVVFMVVDALRSDFVYGEESGMKFVQSLIRDGSAIPFTAHATSPTITMPRVKAMTTGSVPSFLDVILNFLESDTTSSLAKQDTWLAQLRAKEGGRLVMYGDDTWLKLFPGFFERADGTSSFFVSDFTEVDHNVTRHVPGEMLNEDWNAMVLHYLGLDHIGHKTGPRGPAMVPKQIEMDHIVQQIYDAIDNEDHLSNTLFVLCGDHGMNDAGNHGGSSPGETSPALVFMSPKIKKITEFMSRESPTEPSADFDYYRKIEQSDIAPTLAGLLGFPIPRNNLGVFIEEFLYFWDDGVDRIHLLMQNAKQVKRIVEATYAGLSFEDEVAEMDCEKHLSTGEDLACKWQKVVQIMSTVASVHPKLRVDFIYSFLREAQDTMSTTASNYDVSKLYLGTFLAFLSFSFAFLSLNKLTPMSSTGIFYAGILTLYGILMFASSYVEEEHNFWYWASTTWFLYLFILSSRREWSPFFVAHPALMILYLYRITRSWNQTGQKYAGAPDIVHSPLMQGAVLWSLIGATYLDITTRLARHVARSIASEGGDGDGDVDPDEESSQTNRIMGTAAVLPLGITAFVFKLAFTAKDAPELTDGLNQGLVELVGGLELVGVARMVFGGIALTVCWLVVSEGLRGRAQAQAQKRRDGKGGGGGRLSAALFDLLTLFLLTQTSAQNIPLFLIFRLQTFFFSHLPLTPLQTTTTSLLLTQTTFFATGLNNAISSLSLANAYNGIAAYNLPAVAILLFASNWAAPIYWSLFGVRLLAAHAGRKRANTERAIGNTSATQGESERRGWVAAERAHLAQSAQSAQRAEGQADVDVDTKCEAGPWAAHVLVLTLWTSGMLVAVMCACTVLRAHLFVWSVFSPKFLFAAAWALAWHLGVNVGVGGWFWWVGNW